jgi:DNA helicase-2/ATP-dependent DNA helicase PcrA
MTDLSVADEDIDQEADRIIRESLDLDKPVSFFLYAGAGSGKTRSLVGAINHVLTKSGRRLSLSRQKIGVITYTNAACDEIKHRLEYDPRVEVSTIHAFAWSLIEGRTEDIRAWVTSELTRRVAELSETVAGTKNRATKTYQERIRSLESKQRRLEQLPSVEKFIYSPTGDNRTRDALNHSEVISMVSQFLSRKPALQRLLVSRFPILLVDESQDTNKHLMEALLAVQAANSADFCLGLIGDTMQRIYTDGKSDLGRGLEGWALPKKVMNHRSAHRVIRLINRVRDDADKQQQVARKDKPEGFVRLFAFSNGVDKDRAEALVAARMASITGDEDWKREGRLFKTLTLEHHMAAARFGFARMFEPIYNADRLQTSLLEGTSAPLRFFGREILPAVKALQEGDRFALAAVVRNSSPLLDAKRLKGMAEDQMDQLGQALKGTQELARLFENNRDPSFREVLDVVAKNGLFAVPDALAPFVTPDQSEAQFDFGDFPAEFDAFDSEETLAWREMLDSRFWQIDPYDRYVSGLSPFGTHQGVKGLEFPRVMVVMSDEEARGFLFSYDKLFGLKEKSPADLKKEAEGEETGIDRTRRLFYVTASRAEESLALVCYTDSPARLTSSLVAQGWFDEQEVELPELD